MANGFGSELLSGGAAPAPKAAPKKESGEGLSFSDELLNPGGSAGFLGDTPLDSVFTEENIGTGQSAGIGTQFKTGFVDDPQAKIRIYAATRFPDMPENERVARYGVHNGEIVYQGDRGQLFRETDDTWFQKAKRFAAETGANLPAIVMGAVGATAGPGTAALLAAGGEGIRKSVGAGLGEKQTATGNIVDMATEAALALTGEVGGKLAGKGLAKLGAKRGGRLAAAAGRGAADIDTPAAAELKRIGSRHGIELLPPQTTGSKRLADKFGLLGDIDASAPIIQRAREKQAKEVGEASLEMIRKTSPGTKGAFEAGGKIVKAAQEAVLRPVNVRRTKASPIYTKAFAEKTPVETSQVVEQVDQLLGKTVKGDPSFATLTRIKNMVKQSGDDLEKLHRVKTRGIDAVLNKSQADATIRREMKIVKDSLVDAMDTASPRYKRARRVFAEYSEEVEKQGRKTSLAAVSKLEGDQIDRAADMLLGSKKVSPEVIAKTRRAIVKENPAAWRAALRVHLQGVFEKAKESATGGIANIGGHFYKRTFGDPTQRKILRAAMEPRQFAAWAEFMKVLKTTGIILGKESATATRQVSLKEIGSFPGQRFVQALARPLRTPKVVFAQMFDEAMLQKNAKKLAEAFVSEDAAKQLQRIVQIQPGTDKMIKAAATFFTLVTAGGFGRGTKRRIARDERPSRLEVPPNNRRRRRQ